MRGGKYIFSDPRFSFRLNLEMLLNEGFWRKILETILYNLYGNELSSIFENVPKIFKIGPDGFGAYLL